MKKEVILYGFCVVAESISLKNGVKKYTIENDFVKYWDIPNIAFKLAD